MKKTQNQLNAELFQMFANGSQHHWEVLQQVSNALAGQDFNFSADGKTFSGISGHSQNELDFAIDYLKNLLAEIESEEERQKIVALIKLLQKEKETGKKDNGNVENNHRTNKEESAISYDDWHTKAREYAAYAQQRLVGIKSTETPKIDPGKFEKLSKKELLSYFVAEKFYSLSNHERMQLFQCVANKYLESQGVSTCAVLFEDMKLSEHSIEFGCYSPSRGAILINSHLLESIENMDKNPMLPLQILSTIIHEARHRVQFEKFDDMPTTDDEKAIQDSLSSCQENMTFGQYLAEADEIDARNAALVFMREMAVEFDNKNMIEFYNSMKYDELHNKKEKVDARMIGACPEIFDKNYIGDYHNSGKSVTRGVHSAVYQSYAMNHYPVRAK